MTQPKRVLFTIGSMDGGGAERQVVQYLKHLDRSRFTPFLYLLTRTGEMLADVPADVPIVAFADRNRPPRWNFPGRVYRQQVHDLARVLKEERIDALCAVTMLMTLVAARSVALRPTPWLCVEMSDPRLDFALQIHRFRRFKYRLLQRAFQTADAAVAVSDGAREGIGEFYRVDPQRLTTIYNFVDARHIDALAAQPGPSLDPGRFHIATAGRLVTVKGHIYLLQAIRELVHERGRRNVQLHLLGRGPLESELRDFTAAHGLDPFVQFTGYVSNPFAYLRQCRLFCLTSLYEGLPLALLEALVCRVPAIATDCRSGPREILAEGRLGRLVPPADGSALAEAIDDVMQHYDRSLSVVDEARNRVVQTYSPEAGMAKLEALLTTLCR